MAKPDTWMPLYIGDYLADTMHLQPEQHGVYMLLLMASWMRGGTLPDDDAQLALLSRCELKVWRRLRPVISGFFQIDSGTWRHKRVMAELGRATEQAAKAEEKARKAASVRWKQDAPSNAPSNPRSNAPSNAQSSHQAMLEQCPPPSPLPSSEANASSGKTRRTPRAIVVEMATLEADGLPAELAAEWLEHRRARRAKLTPAAWAEVKAQATKARMSPADAVRKCLHRGWTGFEAEWLAGKGPQKLTNSEKTAEAYKLVFGKEMPA